MNTIFSRQRSVLISEENKDKQRPVYKGLPMRNDTRIKLITLSIAGLACIFGFRFFLQPAKVEMTEEYCIYDYDFEKDQDAREMAKKYFSLKPEEKKELLWKICNDQCTRLQYPYEIVLNSSSLDSEVVAVYSNGESGRMISVYFEKFDKLSFEKAVESVCHEMAHAEQELCCEIFISIPGRYIDNVLLKDRFTDAPQYLYEFRNYREKSNTTHGYYGMSLEQDARDYARREAQLYMKLIEGPIEGFTRPPAVWKTEAEKETPLYDFLTSRSNYSSAYFLDLDGDGITEMLFCNGTGHPDGVVICKADDGTIEMLSELGSFGRILYYCC